MFIENERHEEELAQVSVSNVVKREKTLAGIALAIVVVFMECILYGSRCWLNDYYWGRFFNDWAIRHVTKCGEKMLEAFNKLDWIF